MIVHTCNFKVCIKKNDKWINIQINTTSETFFTLNILGSMGLWNVTLTGENGGSYVTHSWLPSMHDNLDSETSEVGGVGEQLSIMNFSRIGQRKETKKKIIYY